MRVSVVIFDLDGTVLDNEDEYADAFKTVLRQFNVFVKVKYPQIGGIGVAENWPYLLSKYKVKTKKSIEELTKETQDAYISDLDYVDLKEGFKKFVNALKTGGIKVALATSNESFIVEKVIEKFSLEGFFETVVTGEEVKLKKPDPDLFLKVAEKLGVEPEECLIIEDAPSGILAAKRAAMKVIAIARNNDHARQLKDADLVIRSFSELSYETVASF